MADTDGTNEIIEQVTAEIARVATVFMQMGACEDCAIGAAIDTVITMLAIEAPRLLCAYRRAVIAQHPEIVAHLN